MKHCNLKAARRCICFHYEVHTGTEFEVSQRIRSWCTTLFAVHTLHYAVISIFDALTSNICNVLAVTWSNNILVFSKIEQSTAEL